MSFYRALVLLVCVSLSSAVTFLTEPEDSCSRQGLKCVVTTSNCLDERWLDSHSFTPSGPEQLQVSVDVSPDQTGRLQPVLLANWSLKDDGSVAQLKATELHVLVLSTNNNVCVRYTLTEQLQQMRSPSGDKWSFSCGVVVLDPGQEYRVSVFNIPKPELGHSSYDVSRDVTVPGCEEPRMRRTQFCVERGSLWQPNISVTHSRSGLYVSFSPDSLGHDYMVLVRCSQHTEHVLLSESGLRIVNVTFSRGKWPKFCCQFDVEVKPVFKKCGQDCMRRRTTLDICPAEAPPTGPDSSVYILVAFGLLLTCVVTANITYFTCRKPGKRGADHPEDERPPQPPLQHPKVLIIYSQDHPLYKDVVLKLCAFLQAKCGTEVLVDLLDAAAVGVVGRVRWLEWQRQQLQGPRDKILVLCSRGVQAKWRALCGQGAVTLREDLLSPTDDMLTPFLNLALPDMHRAGMLGRYVVAYFDGISGEQDVPSVFDIAVKYKLMKHFEELYFRIVGVEKYRPGRVHRVQGIGEDEYFKCPSGRALRDAVQVFQAYQLENPDWFEKQCVDGEEDVVTDLLVDPLGPPPVLECVPLIQGGRPVYVHEVGVAERASAVGVLTPDVNPTRPLLSVVQVAPVAPEGPSPESVYVVNPAGISPPASGQNWLSVEEDAPGLVPAEDDEQDSLLPASRRSDLSRPDSGSAPYFPLSHVSRFQPVEAEEAEESRGKGPSSGSDQGYSSRTSSPLTEDPMVALARLQDELFHQDFLNV